MENKSNNKIKDFIRKQLNSGGDREEIKKQLKESGGGKDQIEKSFQDIKKNNKSSRESGRAAGCRKSLDRCIELID